jgi:hypothetical protein
MFVKSLVTKQTIKRDRCKQSNKHLLTHAVLFLEKNALRTVLMCSATVFRTTTATTAQLLLCKCLRSIACSVVNIRCAYATTDSASVTIAACVIVHGHRTQSATCVDQM